MPNVVDVASFGGITSEYQVRVDPNKLISYGLSIGQVEQQLTNNNVNAGGSFIEAGPAAGQRARGRLVDNVQRYRGDGHHDPERHAHPQSATSRSVAQGPKIRLGQYRQGACIVPDGKIVDNDDVVRRHRAAAQRAPSPTRRSKASTRRSES